MPACNTSKRCSTIRSKVVIFNYTYRATFGDRSVCKVLRVASSMSYALIAAVHGPPTQCGAGDSGNRLSNITCRDLFGELGLQRAA